MPVIVFLGSGRMASAMVAGLRRSAGNGDEIACLSGSGAGARRLAESHGCAALDASRPDEVAAWLKRADLVVLAHKPQQLTAVGAAWASHLSGPPILSVLAGRTVARLREVFPQAGAIIRSMPNTPGQIGRGITAFASPEASPTPTLDLVRRVLAALGEVVETEEKHLDAVTGVSGSGPAYVFEMAAAMREAGIAAGLPPELSWKLTLATLRGASELMAASTETPEALRDAVTSPGGTTAAGLKVFNDRDFRGTVREVVAAATHRAGELAKMG